MTYKIKTIILLLCLIILLFTFITFNTFNNYKFFKPFRISNAEKAYTFIHPTKTGGTACETFFQEHYSEFIKGSGHDNKCTNENNPIIIIRDPIDRFISMYKYWKYGSLDIDKFKRSVLFLQNYNNYTIKDFIQLIKNKQHGDLYQNFTWDQHFEPITKWINSTNYANIIVILYTKNLNEKMNKLLGALNIVNKHIELPIINVSNNKENIQLDDNDILFVKSYFVDDFKLYDDIKNRPELFKYVI
jgi:hypothetical protein